MAQVQIQNVSKVYAAGVRAVDQAQLTVEDGEFLVLVGPSGCGKSTLLRMVAGLEEVTEGRVLIGGRDVTRMPPKDRDVAMVFQSYALYPHMTVEQNLSFALRMRGDSQDQIESRVAEAADILGLEPMLGRKPKELSGGQMQRVALGRAIVRDPAVFLFDEPLSNLDAKLRGEMRVELKRLHRRLGATMIYVTHDQVEAMTLGDRIVVMSGGVIQQVDQPLAVYDKPANRFVAGFLGSPPMNFVPGRLVRENGGWRFLGQDGAVALEVDARRLREAALPATGDAEAVLGVRPEDLEIGDTGEAHLEGVVEVVEPLGDELVVYLSCGEATVVASLPPHAQIAPEDKLLLRPRKERVHLFDGQGKSLRA